jgi:hypothetical protein
VLRKISKSVLLCDEQPITYYLTGDWMLLEEFAESMAVLASGMTEEERGKYIEEGFYEKLIQLRELRGDDMGGLDVVLGTFDGDEEEEESHSMLPPATNRAKVFSIGELS